MDKKRRHYFGQKITQRHLYPDIHFHKTLSGISDKRVVIESLREVELQMLADIEQVRVLEVAVAVEVERYEYGDYLSVAHLTLAFAAAAVFRCLYSIFQSLGVKFFQEIVANTKKNH